MYKIKVDLSQFLTQMNAHKNEMPKVMSDIRAEIALVVERASKQELYPGHGLIKGDLKRSIRINPGPKKTIVAPHTVYASWVEYGGNHPRWNVPTSFRGYQYMEFGAKKGQKEAQRIAESVLTKFFSR